MKKVIYALILLLVVVSGLVFANREIKNETPEKEATKKKSKNRYSQMSKEDKEIQLKYDSLKKKKMLGSLR
mgnify:CR=1 FL=1